MERLNQRTKRNDYSDLNKRKSSSSRNSWTIDDENSKRRNKSNSCKWKNNSRTIWLSVFLCCCLYLLENVVVEGSNGGTEKDWSTKCPQSCQCKWVSGKRTAECKDAGYKTIPSGFSDELQVLNLERNSITSLTKEVFKNSGLLNLQKIYLKNNKIDRVSKDAFRDLQILIELDLSDNKITSLDMESFETNARLRELNLGNNPLTKLTGTQFPRLEQFKILDLKDCKLSQFGRKSFEKLTNLELLDLSGNRFQYISVEILQPLEKLKSLNLQGNPWRCDCQLKSFRDWTMSKKLIQSGVTCTEPDNLANLDWIKLLTENFACKPEILTLQINGQATDAYIHGDVGEEIKLECLVRANPPARVRWMREGLLVDNSTTSIPGRTYVVHISGDREKWVNLTIEKSIPADAGEYTCHGDNAGGTVVKNLTLNFQDVPSGAGVGVSGVGGYGGDSRSYWFWILLGVVGTLLVLVLIITLIICSRRRRRAKTGRSQDLKSSQQQPLVDNHSTGIISDPSTPQRQGPGDGTTPLLTKPFLTTEDEGTADYPDILDSHRRTQESPAGSSSASTAPDPTRLIMPQQLNPAELYDHAGNPVIAIPLHYHPLIHHGIGRPNSPFSGSIASFSSEPPQAIVPPANRPGYVTLPRRPRVPSWSPGTQTPTYPLASSPTGSSMSTTAGYPYVGPKYDNLGPRTTADGSSKLSLNKVGVEPNALPSTPQYYGGTLPHSTRSPAYRASPMPLQHTPQSHFNFAPIQENDDGPTTPPENGLPSTEHGTPLSTLPRSWKSPNSYQTTPKVNGGPSHRVSPSPRPLSTPTEKKVPPKPPPKPKKGISNAQSALIEDPAAELIEETAMVPIKPSSSSAAQKIGSGDDGTEV